MKAYAYLRVSSRGQSEEGKDGFPRQLAAIEKYAQTKGIELVNVYREQITGTSDHEERPAMREMLKEIASGAVRVVMIEKLDRLARDVVIQEGVISKFIALGCELVSTAEPDLCSADPTRIFIRQVLGAVAGLDRALTVSKLRAARERQRAKNGKCEGRKRFGENQDEAAILREIFARSHFPAGVIAEDLNIRRVPTRSGKPWRASVIRKILARQKLFIPNRIT